MQTQNLDKELEIKALHEDGYFEGYASVYQLVDNHNDMVVKGAFSKALKKPGEVKLLWQHKQDEPIGVIHKLEEREQGLYIEGQLLLDVARAREAYSLLKSGAMNGLSIGYSVVDAEVDIQTGVRLLKELELFEVSLVTFPANEAAQIQRVKTDELPTERTFEHFLREAGFSRREAKAIVAFGFKSLMEETESREAKMISTEEIIESERAIDRAILSLLN